MDSLRAYRVWLCVSIAALLVVGWFLIKPKGTEYPAYLAISAQPDGTKAIAMMIEEKGLHVKEWKQPVRSLPNHGGQVLLSIAPSDMKQAEREELLDWVRMGNDVILFEKGTVSWEEAGFYGRNEADGTYKERSIQGPMLGSGMTGFVQTESRLDKNPSMEELLYDDQGILAGRTHVGQGSVTMFLVPEWMTNKEIDRLSHFEAIWPYLQGKWSVVWIDEYHHGVQQNPGLLAVYPGWLIAGSIQLVIGLLLWLWWRGKRFGPVYTLREWTVRRGDETLLAVASWYERQGLALDALRHRESYMRLLMHERWGLPQRADRTAIRRVAQTKWNERETGKLDLLLERLEQARTGGRYTTKLLLADSLLLDEITKRLEKE